MKGLLERAQRIAQAAQQRSIARLAAEWRERVPHARITVGHDSIGIAARGIGRRWLGDPLLRFVGRSR